MNFILWLSNPDRNHIALIFFGINLKNTEEILVKWKSLGGKKTVRIFQKGGNEYPSDF